MPGDFGQPLPAAAALQRLAATAAQDGDRSAQVAAVRKAVELCLATGQLFGWLIGAVQELLVAGGWMALADLPAGQDESVLSAVLKGLQGAREQALRANEALNNHVEIVKVRAASAVTFTQSGDLAGAVPEVAGGLPWNPRLNRGEILAVSCRHKHQRAYSWLALAPWRKPT